MGKYVEPMVVDGNGNIYYSAECINGIKDKQQEEIKRLSKTLEEEKNAYNRMYNMYVEKDNIINELDNWLGKKILSWEDDGNVSDNIYHERLAIQMIYFKLQELKGEDKE